MHFIHACLYRQKRLAEALHRAQTYHNLKQGLWTKLTWIGFVSIRGVGTVDLQMVSKCNFLEGEQIAWLRQTSLAFCIDHSGFLSFMILASETRTWLKLPGFIPLVFPLTHEWECTSFKIWLGNFMITRIHLFDLLCCFILFLVLKTDAVAGDAA